MLFVACSLALLAVIDRVEPGLVNWSKVDLQPTTRFAMVENCNYVVSASAELQHA